MTQPRLPIKSDFPSSLTLDIVPPSTGPAVNILILLHGLGDTNKSFTNLGTFPPFPSSTAPLPDLHLSSTSNLPTHHPSTTKIRTKTYPRHLGKNLNLPETASLSLQAPNPIPSLFIGSEQPAFHWGDDVLFDEGKGEIELDAGFKTSTKILGDLIDILKSKCNYPQRHILFLGFGQGGMAALSTVVASPEVEYGGVVSIGGALPSSSSSTNQPKAKTPVLVCGGSRSSQVTRSSVDRLKAAFGEVEYVKWERPDDEMMRNREEMLPVMKFFARRLRSRAGVPEGAMEV
jgi:predicted esterase